MFLVQLFGKSELKKTDRNQEEQKETIFLSLDAMWQQLIKGDSIIVIRFKKRISKRKLFMMVKKNKIWKLDIVSQN